MSRLSEKDELDHKQAMEQQSRLYSRCSQEDEERYPPKYAGNITHLSLEETIQLSEKVPEWSYRDDRGSMDHYFGFVGNFRLQIAKEKYGRPKYWLLRCESTSKPPVLLAQYWDITRESAKPKRLFDQLDKVFRYAETSYKDLVERRKRQKAEKERKHFEKVLAEAHSLLK